MRGPDQEQGALFSYLSIEQRVPEDHPLRAIRALVDPVLKQLSRRFSGLYSDTGRPSIPPEQLLRALLLQVLYTVRSERQLMEQLDYNLLFRWFVGLGMDEAVWDATTFSKNRDRFLEGEVAEAFFQEVLGHAEKRSLLSSEHFTVDGTLVQAWAGQKSFQPRNGGERPESDDPGNPSVDFRGEKRRNETHASTTDPDARLYRKGRGQESRLCYLGHVLMENRNGLVVDTRVTVAGGTGERDAALSMAKGIPGRRLATLGGDKGYDTRGFVEAQRELEVTPHVAQVTHRTSGIDERTTRHAGYAVSQRRRKRVEEIFGWLKTVGLMRQTRFRGRRRVGWMFTFSAAVYNLVRIRNLALVT